MWFGEKGIWKKWSRARNELWVEERRWILYWLEEKKVRIYRKETWVPNFAQGDVRLDSAFLPKLWDLCHWQEVTGFRRDTSTNGFEQGHTVRNREPLSLVLWVRREESLHRPSVSLLLWSLLNQERKCHKWQDFFLGWPLYIVSYKYI